MNDDSTRQKRAAHLPPLEIHTRDQGRILTSRLFEMMGNLQFHQSISLIKQYSKRNNNEGEVISSLKRFVSCENMYYSANFGNTDNKQDLHSLYSMLSSNLGLLIMTALPETSQTDESLMQSSPTFGELISHIDYFGKNSTADKRLQEEFILSKELLQDCRTLVQLRQEMIAFYRMLARIKQSPRFDNLCKIVLGLRTKYIERVKHEFLIKQVQNATYELDTLYAIFKTDALICKYRYKEAVFSFYKVKHLLHGWSDLYTTTAAITSHPEFPLSPPSPLKAQNPLSPESSLDSKKTDDTLHFDRVISDYQKRNPPHDGVKLLHIVNEDYFNSDKANRMNSSNGDSFTEHRTPRTQQQPASPKKEVSNIVNRESSFIGTLVSKLSKKTPMQRQQAMANDKKSADVNDTMPIVEARAPPTVPQDKKTQQMNQQTCIKDLDSSSPPASVSPILSSTSGASQTVKDKNALTRTNLYKWLNMLFAFAVSKYTLYFRDILRANMRAQFSDLCAIGIVDYYSSIESFANLVNPESVCLVLNCSSVGSPVSLPNNSSNVIPFDCYDIAQSYFELDRQGYSLYARMQQMTAQGEEEISSQSGIRSWPCIFNYPEDQNRQMLILSHWPNLLSLIMDNTEKLNADAEPLFFNDSRSSYYICCVDPRIYLCVMFNYNTKTKPKTNKITHDFMHHMNVYLRGLRLFSYLTTSNAEQ